MKTIQPLKQKNYNQNPLEEIQADFSEHTPAALPTILKCLKDEGYEFVFIEDLIYKKNYEIKHDGTQCKMSQ